MVAASEHVPAVVVSSNFNIWEMVDPVVADPVAQDNDKRKTIYKYVRCKIPWPYFSRKPPALTSIDRRRSASNP